MRVSPCAFAARTLDEALGMARAVTHVTHNHPEGLKGAEATTAAIFLARMGEGKDEIRAYIENHYYPLDFTLDEIRPAYAFDVSCQGSVPPAIVAFLESTDYEDAIRNAVSIGGDSDTIAAITVGTEGHSEAFRKALQHKALGAAVRADEEKRFLGKERRQQDRFGPFPTIEPKRLRNQRVHATAPSVFTNASNSWTIARRSDGRRTRACVRWRSVSP